MAFATLQIVIFASFHNFTSPETCIVTHTQRCVGSTQSGLVPSNVCRVSAGSRLQRGVTAPAPSPAAFLFAGAEPLSRRVGVKPLTQQMELKMELEPPPCRAPLTLHTAHADACLGQG